MRLGGSVRYGNAAINRNQWLGYFIRCVALPPPGVIPFANQAALATGVSLVIGKRFAEAHSGTVAVAAIVWQGSAFIFALPLPLRPANDPVAARAEVAT